MTRCCRDNVNLKSSVYNQTGQSYVDQLSAHRSMCTHQRRILLAKSVVDSRNTRYTRIMQTRRCRASSCKLKFLEGCPSNETINQLAYDSEHHPSEIVRIRRRNISSSKERSCSRDKSFSRDRQRATDDANCSCLRPSKECPSTFGKRNSKRTDDFYCECKAQDPTKDINLCKRQYCRAKSARSSCLSVSARSRKWQHEELASSRISQRLDSSTERSCPATPRPTLPPSSQQEKQQQLCSNQCGSCSIEQQQSFHKSVVRTEEEELYAKFVYDITQEIVQNGLYTDRELKEVFEKHLEKSSARLSKRKMLYEIYQLKISLNMMDESDTEDEAEADQIFAEKFSQLRVPKPPTPPKVLNENKVLEKLQSFKHLQQELFGERSSMTSSPNSKRSVILVDANPEFLVTERDVLSTLMDNNVDPEQIQRIYKNLFQKSKDMTLCEAVQVGTEVAYTHRLKRADSCGSAISLNDTYEKEKRRSILRKECTDFTKKSMPTKRYEYYRCDCLKGKQNEALEKCTRWSMNYGCNCEIQPCKRHMGKEADEKEPRRTSKVRIVVNGEKEKDYANKQVDDNERLSGRIKPEKANGQRSSKTASMEDRFSDISERSDDMPEMITEKRETSIGESVRKSGLSEENDEIEEEIESEIDESQEQFSTTDNKDKYDDEEKELSSVREENENEDKPISIASTYSGDFSDDSGSDRRPASRRTNKSNKAMGNSMDFQTENRRYSTMKDYFDKFTTLDDQKIWPLSEGSSDSSSGASITESILREDYSSERVNQPQQAKKPSGEVIKNRISSGGFKAIDLWKERMSQLSSDFYKNSSKYCDSSCRSSPTVKSCSDNCRFVRTNCRNLSNMTNCSIQGPVKSESSETFSSSETR